MLRCVLLHNTALMSPRLIFALALSLALHASLVLPDLLGRLAVARPRPALQAVLRLPPKPEAPPPAEPLLKNTMDPEETPPEPMQPPKPAPKTTKPTAPKVVAKREVQVAQRKISEHLFYPPEAIARGIEGEVRLIVKLSADGAVEDVSIAASSGHPLLDNAAIKAAYAMGRLTGASSRELILPVIFRLQ
ncbi:MAG: TonB family protein [Proteobacteria bacterium]|nr:TonB family protein [Pseudomonadota bacterium]